MPTTIHKRLCQNTRPLTSSSFASPRAKPELTKAQILELVRHTVSIVLEANIHGHGLSIMVPKSIGLRSVWMLTCARLKTALYNLWHINITLNVSSYHVYKSSVDRYIHMRVCMFVCMYVQTQPRSPWCQFTQDEIATMAAGPPRDKPELTNAQILELVQHRVIIVSGLHN